ncbi:Uncharacterized protein Fot_41752 [Forsythia ovata]|uniref:Vacuolar iron transporter n=1 Tax=Forsythia ovata TaxID=205694 RepID=A0ABD1RJ70_9LAMI
MAADASSEIKISIENEEEKKMIELIERGQWLRAAILGANDGLLSTTSLMLGVGVAKEDKWLMIISGLAGAVAGSSRRNANSGKIVLNNSGFYEATRQQREVVEFNRPSQWPASGR